MQGAAFRTEIILFAFIAAIFSDARHSFAQSQEEDVARDNLVESLMTNSDDVTENTEPLDINEVSLDELVSIVGIDENSAALIIDYRNRRRYIGSLEELYSIQGISRECLDALNRRTITADYRPLQVEVMSYVRIVPEYSALYRDSYSDSGILNFQRLHTSYRDLDVFMVTDKDPGEKNYLDFYSLSVCVREFWGSSASYLGDYTMSLGNGLLFSGGGMVSKTAAPITPLFCSRAFQVRSYSSRGESKFLRGAAVVVPFDRFELAAFASLKKLRARFDSTSRVTSIDNSGLNLPTVASSSLGGLAERLAGTTVRFLPVDWMSTGISAVYFNYDHAFHGYYLDKILALESFLRYNEENAAFSCEFLSDRSVSFVANASIGYREARFAAGVRNLRSRIVQNYSGPLSESFPTNAEQGIYLGATYRPAEAIKLGFYYDRFRMISTSGDPDRSGEEIFVDSYVSLPRGLPFEGTSSLIYLRYKYKTKEDVYVPFAELPASFSVNSKSKQSVRIEFRHKFGSAFSVKARGERIFVQGGEKGDAFLLNCSWGFPVGSVGSGFCFYRTGSFNSAIYAVEENLERVTEFMLFYGDGARLSALANFHLNEATSVGAKVSRDFYSINREFAVRSSSANISGKTELSIEISYSIR